MTKNPLGPITALIFDLDGTLLDVDINVFLDHYIRALTAHVAHLVPPDLFVSAVGGYGIKTSDYYAYKGSSGVLTKALGIRQPRSDLLLI